MVVDDSRNGPVAATLGDFPGAAFREKEFAVLVERESIGAIGGFTHRRDLAGRVQQVRPADTVIGADIGEIERAVGGPKRTLREYKSLLDEFARNSGRQHARD